MPCRIKALLRELVHDWDGLNLAAKVLLVFGIFLFISVVFISIHDSNDIQIKEEIEVVFKSVMASIFGFLLSSNIKNQGIDKSSNNLFRGEIKNNNDEIECDFEKNGEDEYYYREGHSVQILFAFIISFTSSVVILFLLIRGNEYSQSVLSQFRDFMCTSIGFLIGESKIKNK